MTAHYVRLDPDTLARALGGERHGYRITAPGPGHSLKDRSLSVLVDPCAPDGFVVNSFSGDDPIRCKDYVRSKLGLPQWQPNGGGRPDPIANMQARAAAKAAADTKPAETNAAIKKAVAVYDYCDADGQLIYQVVREEPKDFRQRRPDPDNRGAWIRNIQGVTRLPYRLPELRAAVHDTVFICEGEKDVDALTAHGFVSTCNSGGAGKWKPELNQHFSGKSVFILPDNDEPGLKHAQHVAENLYGIAREVRIVNLPGLPEKGDVSDWLHAGGDTSKLIDIAKSAPVWSISSSNERKDGKKDSPRIGSAAELRSKRFPALRYIVPEILAEGCTLLAGRPKLGKSWLMLDIGVAVAAGRFCLGETKCEQGEVLGLFLEDNERRLQRRITKILGAFGTEWPSAFHYATEWPRANEGGLEAIRNWIVSANNPRLVIVDVLAMFRPRSGNRDNQYEADYHAIQGLQALAGEFNVSIVIVHHVRKSGSDVDPFEKVSGTLGLSGAADAVLILDLDGSGATLYGRGRDVEEIEKAVSFDKLTCRWTILGAAAEVRRSDERQDIMAALSESDEPMSPKDIMLATGATSRNAIDIMLFKMAKAGEIERARRGFYALPGKSQPPRKNGKMERFDGDEEEEGDDGE